MKKNKKVKVEDIRAIDDMVFIEPLDVEEQTKSKIFIPVGIKTFQEENIFKTARVVSTGRGTLSNGVIIPFEYGPGDLVFYNVRGSSETILNGKTYTLISNSAVQGIVDGEIIEEDEENEEEKGGEQIKLL